MPGNGLHPPVILRCYHSVNLVNITDAEPFPVLTTRTSVLSVMLYLKRPTQRLRGSAFVLAERVVGPADDGVEPRGHRWEIAEARVDLPTGQIEDLSHSHFPSAVSRIGRSEQVAQELVDRVGLLPGGDGAIAIALRQSLLMARPKVAPAGADRAEGEQNEDRRETGGNGRLSCSSITRIDIPSC